jgi:hypothetical protein
MKTWEIYARRGEQEALVHVGSVEAEEPSAVTEAAEKVHGTDWIEMVAIPQERISWAIREEDQ